MTKPATIRQIYLEPLLPTYWRVTFDHPPLNIFGPETIPQMEEIVSAIERDPDVKVRLVDIASLPADAEIAPEWDAFLASVQRPAAQARIKTLMERGFHQPGDVENRLGYYVGRVGAPARSNGHAASRNTDRDRQGVAR